MVSFSNTFITCFLCIIFAVRVSSNVPKIVGGLEAPRGEFSYQISLRYFGKHRCGGAIVNTRHVVTAARCLMKTDNEKIPATHLTVFVGSTSLSGAAGKIYSIENIFLSNSFSTDPIVTSDIAVIRIAEKLNFDRDVQYVALAQYEYLPGASCTISGWGVAHSSSGELSENLRYAVVQIINRADCQNWFPVATDMLCAGYLHGAIDRCWGDEGGPLVCDNVLTGVISYGYGCGEPKKPSIYTDVRVHHKWIADIIKSSSILIVPFAPIMFAMIIFNQCI